ncbi:hypothetical protein E6H19_00070, partial [Candidatus Bathyarchaeota archaeon]
ISLLEKHRDIFKDEPGLCKLGEHSINIVNNAVIPKSKMYPVPMCYRSEVSAQIKSLLEQDIIERSNSPYAHPIVCIRKKDGTLRLAVDYRAINSVSANDSFPMANSNELLMTVGRAKYITCLDCSQGYFQINLADNGSRERSAFRTTDGLYQFKRMSFGLRSASETFQRVMNRVLENDRDYASAFIDDIAVFSDDWQQHLEHLDAVLTRIFESGLTLKLAKVKLAQQSIRFLGHLIGNGEHRPDPDKFDAISKLIFPNTKKQMRSFIGLISFYRQYIPHLSEKIKCLTDMTKRSHPTVLKPGLQEIEAFELAKNSLVTAPVLRCPDFNKDFIIECDASKYCVGACLVQEFQGKQHPIAFTSAKLSGAQLHWAAIESEAWAVIHALKKFDAFVYGRRITLVTDNNPLVYITKSMPNSGKLVRWNLAIQRYNIVKTIHRKGSQNSNCDALSRLFTTEDVP